MITATAWLHVAVAIPAPERVWSLASLMLAPHRLARLCPTALGQFT